MREDSIDSILFDFFKSLQKLGIELDFSQYQLLLQLLTLEDWSEKKSAEDKKHALFLLCKTLWLPKKKFRQDFENLFRKAYLELAIKADLIAKKESVFKKDVPKIDDTTIDSPIPTTGDEKIIKDPKPLPPAKPLIDENVSNKESTTEEETYNIFLNFKKTMQDSGFEPVTNKRLGSLKKTPFIFTDEKHLPVSSRKAKQIWKKLRKFTIEEASTIIDLPKTVINIVNGDALDVVAFEKEKRSFIKLILLVDHRGAMIAFEAWVKQLIAILEGSIAQTTLSVYYFYNYPMLTEDSEYLDFKVFHSPLHLEVASVSKLISKAEKNSIFCLFSDGGVLDQKTDNKRVHSFLQFFDLLKNQKTIWINPYEEDRWAKSTAQILSSFVKMVPFTEKGMEAAVNHLMQ